MVNGAWLSSLGLHGALIAASVLLLGESSRGREAPPRLIELSFDGKGVEARAPRPRRKARARVQETASPPVVQALVTEPEPETEPEALGAGGGGQIPRDYLELLLAEISRLKHYPRVARLQRLEGKVVVQFEVAADGRIERVELSEPCAHAILNEAALELVRSRLALPAPPAEQRRPWVVRLPIHYSLLPAG